MVCHVMKDKNGKYFLFHKIKSTDVRYEQKITARMHSLRNLSCTIDNWIKSFNQKHSCTYVFKIYLFIGNSLLDRIAIEEIPRKNAGA